MDEQRQNDQLDPSYISSVPIRDIALKTCRKRWAIGMGGERERERERVKDIRAECVT